MTSEAVVGSRLSVTWRRVSPHHVASMALLLSGCATADLDRAGTLSSYGNLKRSDGVLTHTEVAFDTPELLEAKTVALMPTDFAPQPSTDGLDPEQRRLVANAVDRALCHGLNTRLRIVGPGQPADLTVHPVVTHVTPTGALSAGASKVIGIVPSIFAPGVPIPVPRLPIGLGSLTVEAEAKDRHGVQVAAMVWARGADSLTSNARAASDGDAYDLASSFGDDFGKLIVTGQDPVTAGPSLPSVHSLLTKVNIGEGDPDCARFGSEPGVAGMIAKGVGLPPGWTDDGTSAGQASSR